MVKETLLEMTINAYGGVDHLIEEISEKRRGALTKLRDHLQKKRDNSFWEYIQSKDDGDNETMNVAKNNYESAKKHLHSIAKRGINIYGR